MKRHIVTLAVLGGLIALLVLLNAALGLRLYDRIATNLCISLVLVLGLGFAFGDRRVRSGH